MVGKEIVSQDCVSLHILEVICKLSYGHNCYTYSFRAHNFAFLNLVSPALGFLKLYETELLKNENPAEKFLSFYIFCYSLLRTRQRKAVSSWAAYTPSPPQYPVQHMYSSTMQYTSRRGPARSRGKVLHVYQHTFISVNGMRTLGPLGDLRNLWVSEDMWAEGGVVCVKLCYILFLF